MGKSAKNMKRPNRAEKVSRQTNAPPRPRAQSPTESSAQSSIPLFNTSRKSAVVPRSKDPIEIAKLAGGLPTGDDLMQEDEQLDLVEEIASRGAGGDVEGPKGGKKSLKEKVKAAKDSMKIDQTKASAGVNGSGRVAKGLQRGKSNVLGGVDYLKLHEKKLGGMKKKMR